MVVGRHLRTQVHYSRAGFAIRSEVDPAVRTTGAGLSVGGEAAPSFENHRIRTSCDCCCGCGYVGNAAALSKRSVISTAIAPNAPVTPSRQTAIGVRFASA